MDSTVQTLDSYNNNPSVRATIDSLLSKKFSDVDKVASKNLNQTYDELVEEIVKNRLVIAQLKAKKDSIDPKLKNSLDVRIEELITKLKGFEADSVNIVTESAKSKNTSNEEAEMRFKTYVAGKRFGNGLKVTVGGEQVFGSKDSLVTQLNQEISDEIKEDVADEVADVLANLKPNEGGLKEHIRDFKRGLREGKSDGVKSKTKAYETAEKPMQRIKKDSMGIMGVTIAQKDLEDLTPDEIIEKYHVEGFWKQRTVMRVAKFQKTGGDMLHTFFSKFLWIIVLSLLPTAAFLWLLYRRRKRYFVEHVVWLLHVNCLMFILFPMTLIDRYVSFPGFLIYTLLCLILPFFAMKRYYKQGWRKTVLKYSLFTVGYYFIGMFAFLIGGFVSLLFL